MRASGGSTPANQKVGERLPAFPRPLVFLPAYFRLSTMRTAMASACSRVALA